MKFLHKLTVSVFIFVFGFVMFSGSASAVNDNSRRESAACRVKTRQATNVLRFYARQESRILLNYDRRVARLETLSERFAAEGKDVTALNEDIDTLKTMIEGLRTDIDELQAKAEVVKNMSCDDTNRQQAVSDMQAAEQKVRESRRAINQFFGTEIGTDLDALNSEDQS